MNHDHRRLDLDKLVARADTSPPWRCDRFAADGHVTALAGRSGEGKSLLTLALAGGVLTGKPATGIDCQRGRVAIFDAENGEWVIGQRLNAAAIPHDGLAAYLADGIDLRRTADVEWIVREIHEGDISLAIFDSLRTLAPGAKENDSDDMAPVMGALRGIARATGAAVVVIHHRGKSDESDFRGSSAIRDQVDLMLVLGREPKDPEGRHRRYLRTAKCRIAEEADPRWLSIEFWRGQLTITETEPYEGQARPTPALDQTADDILAALTTANGPLSRAALARQLDRDPSDNTVRRALKRLADDDEATETDQGWTLAISPNGHAGQAGQANGQEAPPPTEGASNGHPGRHPLDADVEHERALTKQQGWETNP